MPELQIPSLNIPSVTDSEPSTVPDTSNTIVQPEIVDENGLLNPFLSNIPDQDKAIVAKYVKDWDAGVTKRFQSIHEEYAPYKELGDFDRLQKTVQIMQVLEDDPVRFYKGLAEIVQQMTGETLDMSDYSQPQPEFQQQEEVDPRDQQIQQLMQTVNELQNNFSQYTASQQEERQMAELDNYLSSLHNEYGDFDDDWVLVQISRGIDPVKAVQNWNAKIDEQVSSRRKTTPPAIMQGAGSVPGGQVDPSKFSPQQRKEYVAAMLAASANQ